MAKQNEGDAEEKRLKRIAKHKKEILDLENGTYESLRKSTGVLDSITSQIFGLTKSKFYDQISGTQQDISNLNDAFAKTNEELQDAATAVNKDFREAIKNATKDSKKLGYDFNASVNNLADGLSKKMPEIAAEIKEAMATKDFTKMSDEAIKQFQKLVKDKQGFGAFKEFYDTKAVKDLKVIRGEMAQLEVAEKMLGKEAFNWGKALNSIAERLTKEFNLKNIWETLKGFDKTLTEMQMNTGIAFKENTTAMADMTSSTQQFGMGVKEAGELMGQLGGTLRTTDFNVLSGAAKDMAAVGKATGLSATEVGELGGQMMLMGKTSKDVNKLAESTMKSAMNFGVNGRKIMQDIAKNIPKFRQMGFQGGEESLKRMALQAERMGQNIDEIFDMSTKARNIEGAMDMAAELQLAGGSFANINPMELLSAARKGPEELQKILGQMGGDIGKFNKETGEMAFDAVDYDRLQMVATATGMSVDSLQKQISTMNKDAQKTELIPPGLFDSLSPEEQAFLLNNVGKDGSLTMKMDGVKELGNLNKDNIKKQMEISAKEKGNLEDQAKQNIGFEESMANLKASIMNMFVFFEPFIKGLTSFIVGINSAFSGLPVGLKLVIALLLGGLALAFSAGKQFASGMAFGKGHKAGLEGGGGISSLFGKGKKSPVPSTPDVSAPGGAGGGGLKGFATAIKEMSKEAASIDMKGILKLSASIFLLVAPIGALAMVFSKVDPMLLLAFGGVMVEMSLAMLLMSKITGQISIGSVLKGALAMVIMGAALIPFGYAMTMFEGVSWGTLGIAAVAILGAAVLLAGLGVFAPLILTGALVLAAAGVALMAFGASMMVISSGLESMTKIDWNALSGMGPALLTIAAAGALGLIGSFGLLGMTFALMGLAGVMVVLAPAMSLAAASTKSMAEGITQLKEAIKGLDTSKLESLASASERISSGSAIGGIANAISGAFGGGKEEGATTVKIEPITINLKMNGRMIQTEIIEANQHTT